MRGISFIVRVWIFLVFVAPLAFVEVTVFLFSTWFLVLFTVGSVLWWTVRACLLGLWRRLFSSRTHGLNTAHRESSSSIANQYGSFLPSRRTYRIPKPRIRSDSSSLNSTSSLQSLVGTGADRDFEGIGGWAASNEDSEALYMAKTFHLNEPSFSSAAHHRSRSQSSRISSRSMSVEFKIVSGSTRSPSFEQ